MLKEGLNIFREPAMEVNLEKSERSDLYISAVNSLQKAETLSDIIKALQDLDKSAAQGALGAIRLINDIKLSLHSIASKCPFVPES